MPVTNNSKKSTKAQLIVEKSSGEFWGRSKIKGNLITDVADSLEALKKQMKRAIQEIENVEVDEFEVSFDLTSFFENYSYINVSQIAQVSGINYGLMRQYAAGNKYPSEERLKEIEAAIHQIGKELIKVKLHKPQKVTA